MTKFTLQIREAGCYRGPRRILRHPSICFQFVPAKRKNSELVIPQSERKSHLSLVFRITIHLRTFNDVLGSLSMTYNTERMMLPMFQFGSQTGAAPSQNKPNSACTNEL